MPHDDDIDRLRADLRRLWRAAPGGTWAAPGTQALPSAVVSIGPDGRTGYLGAFFYGEAVAQLAAAAGNALPVLFAEIDRLRGARAVPVVGTVGEGGVVTWRGTPPAVATV